MHASGKLICALLVVLTATAGCAAPGRESSGVNGTTIVIAGAHPPLVGARAPTIPSGLISLSFASTPALLSARPTAPMTAHSEYLRPREGIC